MVTFDPPENTGGIERRTTDYTKELVRRGHSITLISLAPHHGFGKRSFEGTMLIELPSSVRKLPYVCLSALNLIRKNTIDTVLLLSGSFTAFGLLVLSYSRIRHLPSIAFFYGKDLLWSRRSRLGRLFKWVTLILAKKVAVNSSFTMGLLPKGLSGKYLVIYPSVDCDQLAGQSSDAEITSGGRVLFVGRLVERKGVDLLLVAFHEVSKRMPRAGLDIVGDGPEMSKLLKLAKELGLEQTVHFHGSQQGKNLVRQYSACDVLVMPSKKTTEDVEGFGTVFIEAGLMGKPSIGTASGGIPEAVIDGVTGLLVPEGDVPALTDALVRLLTEPGLRERLGSAARARVLSSFRIQDAANLIESALVR